MTNGKAVFSISHFLFFIACNAVVLTGPVFNGKCEMENTALPLVIEGQWRTSEREPSAR
jgi:hypothetical protein